ncbi:MAG: dockerin type I repeat-containing protein [Oscillospiraceae bacterium]|nr:dockerin type I repeat-containing protein [Oscillospiraceae bacterium]
MEKAISILMALAIVLAMSTGLSITAEEDVYLKITVSDVVQTEDDTYLIYTTYENTGGYHFIQGEIRVNFDPDQIAFIKFSNRWGSLYGVHASFGIPGKGFDILNNIINNAESDYLLSILVHHTGVPETSGDFLCFEFELLNSDLTEIDFDISLYGVAFEIGISPLPPIYKLPDDNIIFVNNDNGKIALSPAGAHTHTPGEWEIIQAATCEEAGTQVKKCTECDEILETEEIAALGHDFGEWTVVTPATVIAEGLERRVCSRCGEEETCVIPKLPIFFGQVSGSGTLNITDARMLLQHLVGKALLTPEQQAIADVDGDENVTITDARLILQKLVGKIDKFPAEQ